MIQDFINCLFGFLAGFFILIHAYKAHKDKQVKGLSILSVGFFTTLGIWNIYYYIHLNQILSFISALFVAVANVLWLGLLIYYKDNKE